MKKPPLCPILTIGFAPPKEGEPDIRRCTEECALYDEQCNQCSIKTTAEQLMEIQSEINIMADAVYFQEDDLLDVYEYDPNTIGSTH